MREHLGFTWFNIGPIFTGNNEEKISLANMDITKVV